MRLIKRSVFSFQSTVYFAILKIRTHYSCTNKFPKGRTCKKSLFDRPEDILSVLEVEYTISSERKEIRTPGQNDFILKIVCRLCCKD